MFHGAQDINVKLSAWNVSCSCWRCIIVRLTGGIYYNTIDIRCTLLSVNPNRDLYYSTVGRYC